MSNPSPTALGTRAAGVIQIAVSSGITQVSGVSFSLSDSLQQSFEGPGAGRRDNAAKHKAEVVTQSLGVQVQGVQSVDVD